MKIGVFSITSPIHTDEIFSKSNGEFLNDIENRINYELVDRGADFSDYGSYDMNLIYIRTGGTEGIFKQLYEGLQGPFYLLTSGRSNSLAASMEILSFLRSEGQEAEIIHGDPGYLAKRIVMLAKVRHAMKILDGSRYGVVGVPSEWLIASGTDYRKVKEKLGIELVDIPMKELIDEISLKEFPEHVKDYLKDDYDQDTLEGALHIYGALSRIVEKHGLSGLTVRCFDLLNGIRNTSCLAMGILNKEGIVAGCEGDIPAMLSMAVLHALTGKAGFLANPSSIDVANNQIIFAHCTVPLNMVENYCFESHFESGIGVALRGKIPPGNATVFKASADLNRYFVSDAVILDNLCSTHLCRTQIKVKPEKSVQYFLRNSIGNHHIILKGHYADMVDEFFRIINSDEGCSAE